MEERERERDRHREKVSGPTVICGRRGCRSKENTGAWTVTVRNEGITRPRVFYIEEGSWDGIAALLA